jgi:hypothetical protein
MAVQILSRDPHIGHGLYLKPFQQPRPWGEAAHGSGESIIVPLGTFLE